MVAASDAMEEAWLVSPFNAAIAAVSACTS
jgi:hypothetical protein